MTNIIKLANTEKFFLANYTRMQPIIPIVRECYKQFSLKAPNDFSETKLFHQTKDTLIEFDFTDFNKRFGDYNIPVDGELIFKP